MGDTGHGQVNGVQRVREGAAAGPRPGVTCGSPPRALPLHSTAVRGFLVCCAGLVAAIALLGADGAATEDAPDGVALVDSCGTYVGMREGGASYSAAQLERTRLCSDLLWQTAEALKARVIGAGERPRRGNEDPVRCALDPTPMGPHQSVRVAHRYLTLHPERLHLPAAQLASEALLDAFGCEAAGGE